MNSNHTPTNTDGAVNTAFQAAVDFLLHQLPMFSNIGASALKPKLDNIISLCEALDNPHLKFKSIHIAGTNGKGSTSHIMAAALQTAGYQTGLYTSPHLVDIRERIRINGQLVSKEFVIAFVDKIKPLIDIIKPSYFELNVAMAFAAFATHKVDIAVIETGLGGRWDSTNIITPVLSIITNISYDHVQILGETLPEIAREKAGIIKEKIPVVIGETHPETESLFFTESLKKQAPIYFADTLWDLVKVNQDPEYCYFKAINKATQTITSLKTDLQGDYQTHNMKTALTACNVLQHTGWNISTNDIIKSLESVKQISGLRGRWEILQKNPNIILDVAHNPAGLELAIRNVQLVTSAPPYIVIGFVKDKDAMAALKLLPKNAHYYFTQAQVPRALPYNELLSMAHEIGLQGQGFLTVKQAISAATAELSATDTLLITGSFFIVGEAIIALEHGHEV
jgi:dihydrofolate synthase/folylpolyglutamate synthase